MKFRMIAVVVSAVACVLSTAAPAQDLKTENVVLLMFDGLRWEDLYTGADPELLNKEFGNVRDERVIKERFWRDTPEQRRETLLPFIWSTVAKEGQIFGNQTKGSIAQITNGMNFSYPGYNEILCGFADPKVDSNAKKLNENVTVFEWLHGKPAFQGKVAAFGAWDVFPFIFNHERCGFPVNAGYDPLIIDPMTPAIETLNRLKEGIIRYFPGEPFDAITFETALEYLKLKQPRALFLSLGETDEWAHAGRYDLYLESAQLTDGYIRRLWETLQSMEQYAGKTTLILATDHGRGVAPVLWRNHGDRNPGSENTWYAFLGPDTAPKGEWSNGPKVTQDQIAATLAAFLGEDYPAAQPKAGKPIAEVLGR